MDCVYVHPACMGITIVFSDMGTLEFELGIGLAHGCSQYVDFDTPSESK